MPKKRKTTSDPQRIQAILDFLHLGYKDYVGARSLLRASLPIQGAVLGSTAVEKYLKAILAMRGNRAHGHLQKAHWNALQNYLPELWTSLNPRFLLFLQRCYQLRYTDSVPAGFNIVAYSREVLAELDHTIVNIQRQLRLTRSSGEVVRTAFDQGVATRATVLFDDNHLLIGQEKAAFLLEPDSACAIRHRGAEGMLEVEFTVFHSPSDGNFEREALIPMTEEDLRRKEEERAR